jgi:hypothetical protein
VGKKKVELLDEKLEGMMLRETYPKGQSGKET